MTLEEHIKRYDDRAKSIRRAVIDKKESQEVVELLRELKAYEEAREVLQEQIDRYGQEYDAEGIEALEMAIKALEQADVLDKIRAEIMDFEEELFHRPNTDYTDYAAVRHCVEIIDKYKAESKIEQALAYADQDTLMPAT